MLIFIRERAKGWIAAGIIALLILTFIVWGVQMDFSPESEDSVAEVEGGQISKLEFQRAYEAQRVETRKRFGENFDPVKANVLDSLITNRLVADQFYEAGARISSGQLFEKIRQTNEFQREGRFDPDLYNIVLRSRGDAPEAYAARLSQQLVGDQLRLGIIRSSFLTEQELEEIIILKAQRRDVGVLSLSLEEVKRQANLTEEDIQAWYRQNKDKFAVPEQVIAEYLMLDSAQLESAVDVTEADLRRYYESRAVEFRTEEERRARHILIKVAQDAPTEAVEAARERAQKLLDELRQGAEFEKLAKAASEDEGSAALGGDLGFFGHGIMVKPFEDAVFSMGKGDLSDLVRTAFGFHIIKLVEIRPGTTRAFADVRDSIEADYRRERARDRFYEKLEILADLTYENPKSLSAAAKELRLEIQKTPVFSTVEGTEIAAEPRVRAAAFSEDVLESGNNSEPIDIGRNRVVVLRIVERQPPSTKPLDAVREQIETELAEQRAKEQAQAIAESAAARIAEGDDPVRVAKELGGEWQRISDLGREDDRFDRPIVEAAFNAEIPSSSVPATATAETASGGVVAIVVYKAMDADPAKIDAAERDRVKKRQTALFGITEYRKYLASLKAAADVTEYPDRL